MFYNTISASGDQLDAFQKRTEKQEEIVLWIFKNAPSGLSPWQCHSICRSYGYHFPVTSVRRAITNLYNAGKLEKTSKQVKGIYGIAEHVWRLAT